MAETEIAAACEADQLTFFDALSEGFDRATAQREIIEHHYNIAGFNVRLRFAGAALIPFITPALAHLKHNGGSDANFTIDLFDAKSTGSRLPLLADRLIELIRLRWWEQLEGRREIKGLNGDRIRSVFHLGPDILSVFDRERNHALYWVDDAESIPYYEKGYPLSVLLNWWLAQQDRYFVHAAAIGLKQGGILLTGKGGSGKSTTTLACVMSELGIVSDDYTVVDPANGQLYSLYNTVKLKGKKDVERFPALKSWISNLDRVEEGEDGEKAMIFLHQHCPRTLITNMPLRAIVVPRIVDRPETVISPVSAALAFKALAPSTLFQLPGNAHHAFQGLVQMVRHTPCYEIALGSDIAAIPATIQRFLEQSET